MQGPISLDLVQVGHDKEEITGLLYREKAATGHIHTCEWGRDGGGEEWLEEAASVRPSGGARLTKSTVEALNSRSSSRLQLNDIDTIVQGLNPVQSDNKRYNHCKC